VDETFVGIQVGAMSWWRGNAGRALGQFPDHRGTEPDGLKGGDFLDYDPRLLEAASLRHLRALDPLHANFDALADVIPDATRRRVDDVENLRLIERAYVRGNLSVKDRAHLWPMADQQVTLKLPGVSA
jgi:hypothetical protein